MRGDFDEDEIDDFEPDGIEDEDPDEICADCGRTESMMNGCSILRSADVCRL